jgi:cell wall-associated NlpC family hydrolase
MPLSWTVLRRVAAFALAASLASPAPLLAQEFSLASQARAQVGTVVDKVWTGAQDLAFYALGLIGVEYRYGGEAPESGLDCSGLVRHVFQQVTGVTLPRTSKELSRMGDSIARQDLQPGDLVFFNTRRFAFSHVGIYLGEGRFIHAPRTGRDVEVAELGNRYWQKRFDGARRLVGTLPALVPSLVSTAEAAVASPASAAAADAADEPPLLP